MDPSAHAGGTDLIRLIRLSELALDNKDGPPYDLVSDLHLNKNINQAGFPRLRSVRNRLALLPATAMLVCFTSNCRNSVQPENRKTQNMNHMSENKPAPS